MEIYIKHAPSCVHFCQKKCVQDKVWLLYIFFPNHSTQAATSEFMYNTSTLDDKQLLLKLHWSRSHTSTTYHHSCLPCRFFAHTGATILFESTLNGINHYETNKHLKAKIFIYVARLEDFYMYVLAITYVAGYLADMICVANLLCTL